MTTAWIVGIIVTLLLALLSYLIKGLLAWASVTSTLQIQVQELSHKSDKMEKGVEQIQATMLRPEHLQLAVANLRVEVLKEAMDSMGGRRQHQSGKT